MSLEAGCFMKYFSIVRHLYSVYYWILKMFWKTMLITFGKWFYAIYIVEDFKV